MMKREKKGIMMKNRETTIKNDETYEKKTMKNDEKEKKQ